MADLDRLINRFIENEIKLSQSDISASAKSREWLLSGIKNKIAEKHNQPMLYSEKPFFYFGSYFKGTKYHFLDEYDIMVVIDCKGGQFTRVGNKFGEGIGKASPNPRYSGRYHKEDCSGISPTKMLNWLKGIVEEVVSPYGMEAPTKNGQAITVYTKSTNTMFDLVPAGIFRNTSSGETFFSITKGDKENGWIFTNPEKDIHLLNIHAKDRINYKNIIRLIKFIKDKYNFLISSFAIECNSISYSSLNYWNNTLSQDFLGVLGHFQRNLSNGIILDTFDFETNVVKGVESLNWYADRVGKIINSINGLRLFLNENDAYQKLYNIMYNK